MNPNRVPYKGHPMTDDIKQKIKLTSRLKHTIGGYRKGSGRGKKGWYKGYFCDSSWELAFVIYNLDHNIEIKRNVDRFEYLYNNETHNYLPDFLIDDIYYEIKGYKSDQWMAKYNQFPANKTLVVIGKDEIKPYLTYVIETYGDDFIKLYEDI